MTRRQIGVCALVCGLAVGMHAGVRAQTQPAKPSRPQGEALRIEQPAQAPAPNPELDRLLVAWERESAKIHKMTGKHERSEFNDVFQTETRTTGQFFFEAPDKGRIDMVGIKIKPGDVAGRADKKTGAPYKLQAGHNERWVCNGMTVIQINDETKEYETIPIPPEFQGENIIRSPLPFLFGMKAAEAKQRFKFELIPSASAEYYALKVEPKTSQDAFRMAYVKLDRRQFVPTAVILFDPSGGQEQRYTFSDIEINDAGIGARVAQMFGRDPFRPSLNGYKRVQTPIQQAGGQQPAGQKAPVGPAGQQPVIPLRPGTSPRVPTPGTSNTTFTPGRSTVR